MINIDVKNGVPIYEQIVSGLKQLIIKGVLKPDEKVPSVRELGRRLTINPNTIQKAYRELERQGYFYTVIGKGNFVSDQENNGNVQKLRELTEDIQVLIEEVKYLGVPQEHLINLIHAVYSKEDGER